MMEGITSTVVGTHAHPVVDGVNNGRRCNDLRRHGPGTPTGLTQPSNCGEAANQLSVVVHSTPVALFNIVLESTSELECYVVNDLAELDPTHHPQPKNAIQRELVNVSAMRSAAPTKRSVRSRSPTATLSPAVRTFHV